MRQQDGFSLLEVLIAMLVLVLGLMSAGALVLKALSNGREAYLRGQASLLADEIAESMRANPIYNASQNATWTHYIESRYSDHASAGGMAACNASAWCSQPQLAAFDLMRWKQDVASGLPGAQAIVCWNDAPEAMSATLANPQCSTAPGPGTPIAIAIVWSYKSNTAGAAGSALDGRYVVRFNPVGAN